MPTGNAKNLLYGLALPLIGKRCEWSAVQGGELSDSLARILRRRRVVGACIQRLRGGRLAERYAAGWARLEPDRLAAEESTIFRTASIAKLVTALLVFRLQTQGKLDVREEAGDFLGYPVRNPHCSDAPITLGMLLSHTSGIVDSRAYALALTERRGLRGLLEAPASYRPDIPGAHFQYSNLAAGMIGSMLEARFGESLESLCQRELFAPTGVQATYDVSTLAGRPVADSYRVLPQTLAFRANSRIRNAKPLDAPDPDAHYALASGGLYLTAEALGRLALVAHTGGNGFLSDECLRLMKSRVTRWPDGSAYHGMGVLQLDGPGGSVLYGHQGIAYGAVNGVFWNDAGDGFAMLNSGASEQRRGHLTRLNQDLLALFTSGAEGERHG